MKQLFTAVLIILAFMAKTQPLLLIDRENGNRVVNDSTITISSSDPDIIDLTVYFTMKNNTDRLLSLNLRKTINYIADSTVDYFCFGIKCWPETDTTNYPDTLLPGAEDYTFASHVVHHRRFDMPPLPWGETSITYTVFDNTSFSAPVEASVTVIYNHQADLAVNENSMKAFKVYPNPVVDEIYILTGDDLKEPVRIALFNSSGSLIRSISAVAVDGRIRMPLNDLMSGFYFGKLQCSSGKTNTFRFIRL